jgi:uncharacterized protein YqgV (UPF0045/DUF77 family)
LEESVEFQDFLVALTGPAPVFSRRSGVLGTFTGIFIGLLDFDVSDIDRSVPALLAGLKLAFSTSIIGMGGAVILKVYQAIKAPPKSITGEVTPEAIHASLNTINDSIIRTASQQDEVMEGIRRAISADSDSSLLTQMQRMRTTLQDGQDKLVTEFQQFARTMAENNSKAIIEALEHVVRDFNTQLNEQFGENFKQLNEAVGALLTWQSNYRDYVESLEVQIEIAVQGITTSGVSLQHVAEQAERIPEALVDMKEILGGLISAKNDLGEHLEVFSVLRTQALEAFPVIENNLNDLTSKFGDTVRQAVENSSSVLEQQQTALRLLEKGYNDLLATSGDAQDKFEGAIQESMTAMQTSLTATMEKHSSVVQSNAESMQSQISEAWIKSQETLEGQI